MLARELITRSVVAAAVLSSLAYRSGGAALPVAAQQTDSLPRPPGVGLVTLPREHDDRPAETTVAVNPRDARHVIVTYQRGVGGGDHDIGVPVTAHVAWSADGGETWAVATGTTHEHYSKSLDTYVTFDPHGHAFLVYLAMDSISLTTRHGLFVHRSLDGGRTWEAPITLIEQPATRDWLLEDKPYIFADNHAASSYVGNLYVGWHRISRFSPQAQKRKTEILFARSTDDGKTWSRPMVISSGSEPNAEMFHAAVGRDGTVYAMWTDGYGGIVLAVSRDGGQTFEPSRRVLRARTPTLPIMPNFRNASALPAIAIDPRGSPGKLFIVWADYGYWWDMDIMASTSDDGGRTWTPAVRVNDDPEGLLPNQDQIMSWLAVDPSDGTAYVIFYDRRDDPKNVLATVTLARSTDGGRTFTNYAWSVTPSDPRQTLYGDYMGVAAMDGRVYGAWVENVPTLQRAVVNPFGEMSSWAVPAAIRIGIADFRTAAGATRQGTGRR